MLEFISHPTNCYFAIALLHVFSALYFAAVRWFHVCAPYKQHPDYYYPARKWITLMCLFVLVEIPYVLNPVSDICFLTACVVLSWTYPLAAIVCCHYYFRDVSSCGKESSAFVLMMCLVLFAEALFPVFVMLIPGYMEQYYTYVVVVISTVSVLLYSLLAICIYSLYGKIQREYLDNYSDVSRIPTTMGYIALVSMLAIFVLTSLPLVTQSRFSLAIIQAVLVCWHVVFLIYILDSHLGRLSYDVVDCSQDRLCEGKTHVAEVECTDMEKEPLIVEHDMLLLRRIEDVIQTERPYLDSGFTAVDLAMKLGTNRTYLTNAIKIRYDSFYHLVNSYRLKYAEKYLSEHPDIKREQLALASGFGSYRSYLRALKSIGCGLS